MRCAAAAMLAALAAVPAWGKPPLDYRDPPPDPPASGQLAPTDGAGQPGQIPERLVGPGPYRRLPAIDESAWVVVATRRQPYWTAGARDAVLTNACRLGRFASVPLNRLVIRFAGTEGRGVLQVIPPTHRFLLVDAQRLAAPGETYLFRDTGLPTCEVWVQNPTRKRVLDRARGTSLPKPDPNALAKRKQDIASWPK